LNTMAFDLIKGRRTTVQHESHSALALCFEFSVRLILDVFPHRYPI